MKEFVLKLAQEDLDVIRNVLGQIPYDVASPIIEKINEQLKKQQDGKS